jgi:hypothetical protein
MPEDRKIKLTLDDVEEAKVAWRRDAPRRYRALLDAEPAPTRIDDREHEPEPEPDR